jgi:vacuolar-type H+-ATPase subunit F/Vma7
MFRYDTIIMRCAGSEKVNMSPPDEVIHTELSEDEFSLILIDEDLFPEMSVSARRKNKNRRRVQCLSVKLEEMQQEL